MSKLSPHVFDFQSFKAQKLACMRLIPRALHVNKFIQSAYKRQLFDEYSFTNRFRALEYHAEMTQSRDQKTVAPALRTCA